MEFINTIVRQFRSTFIIDSRYKVFLTGFRNTILITVVAALIGVAIGTVIAVIHNIASQKQRRRTLGGTLIRLLDKFFTAYVAVMRGTPLAIQLMIWAFVLLSGKDKLTVACIAFGLNSAAYVSEVIRAGINSVMPGRWRPDVPWVWIGSLPCGRSSCPRPSRISSPPCATKASPC